MKTDVTDYDQVVDLFEFAFAKYGRVDLAISNAGIQETRGWFDPLLNMESVKIVHT